MCSSIEGLRDLVSRNKINVKDPGDFQKSLRAESRTHKTGRDISFNSRSGWTAHLSKVKKWNWEDSTRVMAVIFHVTVATIVVVILALPMVLPNIKGVQSVTPEHKARYGFPRKKYMKPVLAGRTKWRTGETRSLSQVLESMKMSRVEQ